MTELRLLAAQAVMTVRPFLSRQQLAVLAEHCRGEEALHFLRLLVGLADRVRAMPKTGDQATVHLHYFLASADWYILEKDIVSPGVDMAFGFAVHGGKQLDMDLGCISIAEIVRCGAELDLHFKPRSLAEVRAERAKANHVEIFDPADSPELPASFFTNPIVSRPGDDLVNVVAAERKTSEA